MTTATGSRIITTLEHAWSAIQARHPEIPDVVVITGAARQRGGERWGHHWPERWQEADRDERTPELFIAGELLALGGRRIMQTKLHEAAHALGHVRGIKDTSRGGRYHNRRFVALAVELGLSPPASTDTVRGLTAVELGDATAAAYAETIAALDAAALAYLQHPDAALGTTPGTTGETGAGGDDETAGRTRRSRDGLRLAVTCECARRLQVTPKAYQEAPILCGRCGAPFGADPDQLAYVDDPDSPPG